MKIKLIALFVLAGTFYSEAQTLDLETCLKMADTANLTVRNSRLDIAINDKQRDAYMSARLPHLTFAGDYKYNAIIPGQVVPAAFFGGAPGTFTTVQFGVPYTLSNTLQLTQVFYNPQVNYGLTALDINSEIIKIQQAMVAQEVNYQVASTFFNLQAINKQLDFISTNIANLDKLVKNMEAMVEQELIVQIEVDKLQINRLGLINTRESLTATKDQLESLLKILVGLDKDASISIVTDSMVEKSILVENEVNYPELDLLAAQQKMNIEERKGTNMAYLPSLSFYAAYNYNYNLKPEDDYRTGIEGAFLGLRLDWTLFDGLEKYHKQKMNTLNAEKLANQEDLLTQQLEMKSLNAKKQILVHANSLDLYMQQLKLAEKVFAQTELKISQGANSSTDLINAENGLNQAQTNVVSAFIQLRQAELEYLKAIGNIK